MPDACSAIFKTGNDFMDRKIIGFSMKRAGVVCTLVVMLIMAGMTGCSSKKKVTFLITSEPGSNNGRPVYVLVREVNRKDFFIEYYDDIADMIYADPQDDSLLNWQMFLPGEKKKVKVVTPKKSDIGIYGLFTQPGNSWKLMIPKPLEKKYRITIETNNIKQVTDSDKDRDESDET